MKNKQDATAMLC